LCGLGPTKNAAAEAKSGGPAQSAVPILPLTEIRPGMVGYGLTVFAGTQPERFPVRIVGVLRQHLPQMDIILIESDDPRVVHSGIAAGMSGSPIYVEGKLIGALAYGWLFAKDAVGGVTPIEYMLKEVHRPPPQASPSARFVANLPDRRLLLAMLGEPASTFNEAAENSPTISRLRPPRPLPAAALEPRLVRAALPLTLSGFSERAIEVLHQVFEPYGLLPLQGSGAGAPGKRGPERFEPGGALAVELIRGDLSASGTGTVTYVEGDRVAAFGHQMLNAGDVQLPIATAEIVTVLASQMSSFKMSSTLQEKGALVLDRQACIVGNTSQRAPVVPMQVTVRAEKPGSVNEQVFRTELGSHRFLTAPLAQAVVTSAVQASAPDIADAVIEVQSSLEIDGHAPLQQTDYFFSPAGANEKIVIGATGMRQLQDLLTNPFGPVRIGRLDLHVAVGYRAEVAELLSASLPGDELEADTRPNLLVTLRPYGGAPYVRAVPFDVPHFLAGQSIKIEASAGQLVKPEVAPPENLDGFVENLRKGYSARTLVVTLSTLDEGVMLHGHLLPNLPASVIATLRPGGASKRGEPYKRVGRVAVDMGTVLSGKQELTVLVRDDK
jgi:hypothetical protein